MYSLHKIVAEYIVFVCHKWYLCDTVLFCFNDKFESNNKLLRPVHRLSLFTINCIYDGFLF